MMELIIPTKLNEIPLYKMQEYETLPEMDDIDKGLNAVAIFCNLSLKEVSKLPIKILNHALDTIIKVLSEKPKFQPTFEMNGIKYGFHPNLDEMSTGEFVDVDNYQKDRKDLYKMMSVLYRPITTEGQNNRYLIEPYKGKVNEAFKMMPSDVAGGSLVFFWSLGSDLMNSILNYSAEERQRLMNTASIKSGAGWDSFIYSLEEMSQNFKRLASCPFTPLQCGRLTNQTWQHWKSKLLINQDEQ